MEKLHKQSNWNKTEQKTQTRHHSHILGVVAMDAVGSSDDPAGIDENTPTVTAAVQLNQNLIDGHKPASTFRKRVETGAATITVGAHTRYLPGTLSSGTVVGSC